jgi:hypothetical protein
MPWWSDGLFPAANRGERPFVAAILTIIGYSINDTIVLFDRVRENLKGRKKVDLAEIIDRSINQTLLRSINTSGTTLLVLIGPVHSGRCCPAAIYPGPPDRCGDGHLFLHIYCQSDLGSPGRHYQESKRSTQTA